MKTLLEILTNISTLCAMYLFLLLVSLEALERTCNVNAFDDNLLTSGLVFIVVGMLTNMASCLMKDA